METIIRKIVDSDELYARFLNTLSLMEYIGARKIIKTQHQQFMNKKMLGHIGEEMRHALILKKAALRISPTCDTYQPEALLCGEQAYAYFQTVDHAAKSNLNENDVWHCYLYTTYLIEMRVLMFYSKFEKVLEILQKPSVFRGILVEEKNHLEEVIAGLSKIPNYEKNLNQLRKIEEVAFKEFLSSMVKFLALPSSAIPASYPIGLDNGLL